MLVAVLFIARVNACLCITKIHVSCQEGGVEAEDGSRLPDTSLSGEPKKKRGRKCVELCNMLYLYKSHITAYAHPGRAAWRFCLRCVARATSPRSLRIARRTPHTAAPADPTTWALPRLEGSLLAPLLPTAFRLTGYVTDAKAAVPQVKNGSIM